MNNETAKTTVSVIVPVYNAKRLLGDGRLASFDALLAQETRFSYEIVAVDDRSPDGSYEDLLVPYERTHPGMFKAVQSPENLRAGGARNIGLGVSTGDWVCFVDQDDLVSPSFLEMMVVEGERSGADMVGTWWVLDGQSPDGGSAVLEVPWEQQVGKLDRGKRASLMVDPGGLISKAFRRRLLERARRNGRLFPERMAYEDNAIMNTLIIEADLYAFVPKRLYFRKSNEGSVTATVSQAFVEDRISAEIISLERARNEGYLDEYADELEYRFAAVFYWNTVHMLLGADWPAEAKAAVIVDLLEELVREFPSFASNGYYRERRSRKERLATRLQLLSPELATDLMVRARG